MTSKPQPKHSINPFRWLIPNDVPEPEKTRTDAANGTDNPNGTHADTKAKPVSPLTSRTLVATPLPRLEVFPDELVELRKRLQMSRAVFAHYLRTNPRTLENWEQGRAKPNAQAVTLILLVRRDPDLVFSLANL